MRVLAHSAGAMKQPAALHTWAAQGLWQDGQRVTSCDPAWRMAVDGRQLVSPQAPPPPTHTHLGLPAQHEHQVVGCFDLQHNNGTAEHLAGRSKARLWACTRPPYVHKDWCRPRRICGVHAGHRRHKHPAAGRAACRAHAPSLHGHIQARWGARPPARGGSRCTAASAACWAPRAGR